MTTLLILAAVTVAVGASVLGLLWWRDWLIDRTGDRFDYGLTDDDAPRDDNDCGWWVGPIWKAGGEKCVCIEPRGHSLPHRCSCGAWFEECGHPPALEHRTAPRRINGEAS